MAGSAGIVILCLLFMFCLFLIGMNLGLAMALTGLIGIFSIRLFSGMTPVQAFQMALGAFVNGPFSSTSKESLSVIPMFTLMGVFCAQAGISQDLYASCYKWVGRIRGGLAVSTVIACALFGAICGSATATTASMGKICLPEMDKYGYRRRLSCGSISAGGTLGIMIPPSTGLMLYGLSAGVGVGKMFIAGILPGIVLTFCYAATVAVLCIKDPSAAPQGPAFSLREKLLSLQGVLPVLVLFILVLGGILFGWCSATEGGAVGACGALLIFILRGRFSLSRLTEALEETLGTIAMIFLILIGSDILGQFFALANVSQILIGGILAAHMNRWIVLLIFLLVFAVFGCFVDTLPLICLLTPIFLPVIRRLGFDDVWFGVLMVMLMEFGLLTPPIGMSCYVMAGITRGTTPLSEIFRGTAPFLLGISAAIVIVMLFPWLSVALPNAMAA